MEKRNSSKHKLHGFHVLPLQLDEESKVRTWIGVHGEAFVHEVASPGIELADAAVVEPPDHVHQAISIGFRFDLEPLLP